MSKPTSLYYLGSLVTEDTALELSDDFKLPFRVVTETLLRVSQSTDPASGHSGITATRVKALAAALSTQAPENVSDAPQNLVEEEALSREEPGLSAPLSGVVTHAESSNGGENPDVPEANFGIMEDDFNPEQDAIVDNAASSLMQAFSDPDGYFIIDQTGVCTVNPTNPPSVEQAHIAVSHAMKLKELGKVVDDKSSWMLGSLVASMEDLHGENFSVSQLCPQTDKAYNTVAQAVGTYRMFPKPTSGLTYSHHQELTYAKIPETPLRPDTMVTKKLLLTKARSHKLGTKQLRALCSIAKTMEDDTVIRNIRSKQQAEALIDAYKQAKVQYFVYEDGKMERVSGLAGQPPEGKLVIDTKELVFRVNGGEPVQITKRHHTVNS